jgi:hypothetical protein
VWLTHLMRQGLSRPYALPEYTESIDFLYMLLGVLKRQIKVTFGLYDPLTRLAARYKSDKGVTVFPFHGYTVEYAKLFKELRHRPISILEIGLARRTDRKALGIVCPSLSMWAEYFRHAQIYGFDIDDFSSVNLPRTTIFRGDQGSSADLLVVASQCPMFDVIIDDGSHASYHQQVSLRTLFPFLRSGGLYVIEDLHWQPTDLEASLPAARKTLELLKNRPALDAMIAGVRDVLLFEPSGMAAIVKS